MVLINILSTLYLAIGIFIGFFVIKANFYKLKQVDNTVVKNIAIVFVMFVVIVVWPFAMYVALKDR